MIKLDDLQFLILIARFKTLRRAAAAAKVSASTFARHLDRLEEHCAAKLVERLTDGCVLTERGMAVLGWAEQIHDLANNMISYDIEADQRDVVGTVRINTDEWFSYFITMHVAELKMRYPHLEIEVLTSHRPYNLIRREADIAVRAQIPSASDLVCRKLSTMTSGLYCSKLYAEKNKANLSEKNWHALDYVGFDELHVDFAEEAWLRNFAGGVTPWLRSSYALGIYDGIKKPLRHRNII
ncbi:LysR family transcriptional regulator [Asaia sp. HN010]|uniref:LysR family transcriptional regulator n=1 Tax=Asaia sp. HN010 TaxID=3081233 RepID=UPI0030189560